MTSVKERESKITTHSGSKNDVSLEVKSRRDVANGMYEVRVTVDNQSKGSTYILTSPRNLAFRKMG